MRIHKKLILLPFVIGFFMLFIVGISTFGIHYYINDLLIIQSEKQSALYELEININEASSEVLLISQLYEHNKTTKQLFEDAKDDYTRFYKQYEATSNHIKLEQSKLKPNADLFFELGDEIFTNTHKLFNALKTRRQLLHEVIEIELKHTIKPKLYTDSQNSVQKIQSAYEIENNMQKLISAVRGYLLKQDNFLIIHLKESQQELNYWLKIYQEQDLDAAEQKSINKIANTTKQIEVLSHEIIYVKKKLLSDEKQFIALHSALDNILDDNLQYQEAIIFQQKADQLYQLLYSFSLFLTFAIIAVMLVIRSTTWPIIKNINALKKSAQKYHEDKVIDLPVHKEDELGELGRNLEQMMNSLNEYTAKLERMANHDPLTGLPNRTLLDDRLKQAVLQNKRSNNMVAVIFFDLDGFKLINDSFGHKVGDILLTKVAQEVQSQLRAEDTLSRIGGDEFVAVLANITDKKALRPHLNNLLTTIASDHMIEGNPINITASIGVYMVKANNHLDPEQLIKKADQAMYHAKATGKNRIHFFKTND